MCYCFWVKKNISHALLSLVIFFLLFLVCFPYFTASFLQVRLQTEKEEDYQQFLKEELAKKEAEENADYVLYLTGKFDPAQREYFILLPTDHTTIERSKDKIYLRKEAYGAFLNMREAALQGGIDLKIASATRNFDYQKKIWNNKWTGYTIVDGQDLSKSIPDGLERFEKILEYSAVPGASRHHWGTDIDINDANPEYFVTQNGKKVYEWLVQNASTFGFCQTYSVKNYTRPTGYSEEKWHWSYLPLARTFTEEYENLITDNDIKGFNGDKYVHSLDLIDNYVLGINPDCI